VIRGALETVAYEMATHVSLAASTPILNQSNERNADPGRPRAARGALVHGYALRDEEPILRSVRLAAVGRTPKPAFVPPPPVRGPARAAIRARRPAWFGERFVDTPVYDGERLASGHALDGPAIIEERFTAIVLHSGHHAERDAQGHYRISIPVA
jgi:N-methylhydantoinase A/oxoprolinase/acetone carboxylase beta subunit